MELQTPEMVKDWFVDYCLTPRTPAAPAPGRERSSGATSSTPALSSGSEACKEQR
jgi:hypothetical protein